MASGLIDIGLVASNMTLINVYNLVSDVHLLEKLVFLKCNVCCDSKSYLDYRSLVTICSYNDLYF